MKTINFFIWIALAVGTSLVAESTQAQTFNQTVSFRLDQNGMELSGSVRIDGEFVFFGWPYLKVQYSNLTIDNVYYEGRSYHENSGLPSGSGDGIRFPYTFTNTSYRVSARFHIFVAEVSSYGDHPCVVNRQTAVQAYYTTGVYGVSDASEVKELVPHFKQLDSPHKTDAEIWECSEVDTTPPGIEITELSPSIIFEITNKLNKAIKKQEEDQRAAEEKRKVAEAKQKAAEAGQKAVDNVRPSSAASGGGHPAAAIRDGGTRSTNTRTARNTGTESDRTSSSNNTSNSNGISPQTQSNIDLSVKYETLGRQAEMNGDLNTAISHYETAYNYYPTSELRQKINTLRNEAVSDTGADLIISFLQAREQRNQAKEAARNQRIAEENARKAREEELHKKNTLRFKQYIMELKEYVLANSIDVIANWDKHDDFYAVSLFPESSGYGWKMKTKIHYTNKMRIDKEALNIVPVNQRLQIIENALDEVLLDNLDTSSRYSSQPLMLVAASESELDNKLSYIYGMYVSDDVSLLHINFVLHDSGRGKLTSFYDLANHSDSNLLLHSTAEELIQSGELDSGRLVTYLKDGGVVIRKDRKFIRFADVNKIKEFSEANLSNVILSNLESADFYRPSRDQFNTSSARFARVTLNDRLYLPNIDHRVSLNQRELRCCEIINQKKFGLADLGVTYYPPELPLSHFYIAELDHTKGYIPTLITSAGGGYSLDVPKVIRIFIGDLGQNSGSSFNYYPATAILKAKPQKKVEKARLTFGFSHGDRVDIHINKPHLTHFGKHKLNYFGIEATVNAWLGQTKKIKFRKYQVLESKLGYGVEVRYFPDGFEKILDQKFREFREIDDLVAERMGSYFFWLSKPKINYSAAVSISQQPFEIEFQGTTLDLTNTELMVEGNQTAFDLLYNYLSGLTPSSFQLEPATHFVEQLPIQILEKIPTNN